MSFKVTPFKNFTSVFRQSVSSSESAKLWKELPGPTSLPIIQQTHHYLPGGSLYNHHGKDLWKRLYENYGPITTMNIALKDPTVVLLDAECVGKIVQGEIWSPVRYGVDSLVYHRKIRNNEKTVSAALGIEQGETWRKCRSMINQQLLQPKAVEPYRAAFEEVAQDMLKRLKLRRDEHNRMPGNLNQDMGLWTLECVSLVCFGERLNFLDLNMRKDSPKMRLMESILKMVYYLGELDYKPSLWKVFPTKTFTEAMAAYDEKARWTNYFVQQYVDAYKNKKPSDDDQKSVLEKLLDLDLRLGEMLVNGLLSGGTEGAPTMMNGLLYLLASNPDKQDLLRDSLFDNKDNKKYLTACIKEALRLVPAVSGVRRHTTKPYNLLGYDIPAGTSVMLCNDYLSISEKHFPQAEKYIPERWTVDVDDPLSYRKAHRFAYNPFGYGTRVCPGSRLTVLQLETLLETIIKNFKVEWNGPPPTFTYSVFITMNEPHKFTFKDV